MVHSAHDCAEGGLAVALAECCMAGDLGIDVSPEALGRVVERDGCRPDALLFGESQSRVVLSVARDRLPELERLAEGMGVPLAVLGEAVGDVDGEGPRFRLGGWIDLPVARMRHVWDTALERWMRAEG
jgi:phosphoribosylformylglycinamidine synthase